MCRNIRTLFNFEPPATEDEIRAAATQFVRKLSGFTNPSKVNERGVQPRRRRYIEGGPTNCWYRLKPARPPRDREEEARKAKERAKERYALF